MCLSRKSLGMTMLKDFIECRHIPSLRGRELLTQVPACVWWYRGVQMDFLGKILDNSSSKTWSFPDIQGRGLPRKFRVL